MNAGIGHALNQIATLWRIGFNEFEIMEGMTGPVGILLAFRLSPWYGPRE